MADNIEQGGLKNFTENNRETSKKIDENNKKIREQHRFQEQCFLMDNWETLQKMNSVEFAYRPYKNFLIINDDDVGLVIHGLVSKLNQQSMLRLTPAQISLLMPTLQIFKVEYKEENSSVSVEKELFFKDHVGQDSIEKIMQGKSGRGDGVGIKSFSCDFNGKNIIEGGTAECSLKIFFQDINSLIAREGDSASFLDLITNEALYKKTKNHRAYNSKAFRIKIVAGWSSVVDKSGILFTEEEKSSIDNSKIILFLHLNDHELNFLEDGTAELTIKYRGAMEGLLVGDKADIFTVSSAGETAKKIREKEKNNLNLLFQTKNEAKIKESKKTYEEFKDKQIFTAEEEKRAISSNYTKDDELYKKVEKYNLLTLEQEEKQKKYSRILESLRDNGRIYFTNVDQKNIEGFTDKQLKIKENLIKNGELKQRDVNLLETNIRETDRRKTGYVLGSGTAYSPTTLRVWRVDNLNSSPNIINNAIGLTQEITALKREQKDNTVVYSKKSLDEIKNIIEKRFEPISDTEITNTDKECTGCRKIYFFFLGDLLEIVFDVMKVLDKEEIENLRVILGPVLFYDPRDPTATTPVSINLSDIPISLNLFTSWYMKHVISLQRNKYLLGQFLQDLIKTLIIPSLGEGCFSGALNQSVNVNMNFITIPKTKGGIPSAGKMEYDEFLEFVKTSQSTGKESVRDLYHVLYIYSSFVPIYGLNGIREEDEKRGIYHLVIGADNGLMKSIRFSKTDQPFAQEWRATSNSEASKRIRGLYNANIRMIGNTLFHPGSYIYIDIESISKGEIRNNIGESASRILGLGGYYMVTKVSHFFEAGTFETEVEAKWNSFGGQSSTDKRKKIAKERINDVNKIKNIFYKKENLIDNK